MHKIKLKQVDIQDIKPYWRNPRQHPIELIEKLKESIKKFGYNQPIVVDKDGVIVVGHARYRALQELGYNKIYVIEFEGDEKQARQYRLVDNKLSEFASWDTELLPMEMADILDDLRDFYADSEIDSIFGALGMEGVTLEIEEDVNKPVDLGVPDTETEGGKVKVICPNCGHEFSVDIVGKK